jgi:hypothetical protein
MATAFARSLRSLEADGFRRAGVALLCGAVFVGAWATWAVRARIPLFESSSDARIETGGLVVARFPAARAFDRVRAGQPARMRIATGTLEARVVRVDGEARDGTARVELTAPGAAGMPGTPGAVDVEVERAAPFTLLLRAAGGR